jgi:hypothetical protein
VNPGDTASITITTKKGAKCSIDVEYESGRSTAKGLGAKKADAKGQVKWSWLVGINANPQVVGISIGCALGGRSGQVSSSITVK